ncbi:MAG: polysaccharide pyruvyl transferase family protein [Woeseiaceae bacterium]
MKIGVFGHYGNANLGDEAIVQATMESLRRQLPKAEIACFSINPVDSSQRHSVAAYPIRRLSRELTAFPLDGEAPYPVSHFHGPTATPPAVAADTGLRGFLKRIPILKAAVKKSRSMAASLINFPAEIGFLWKNYRLLRSFDLLMVTGSNQFLDNFGGVWGFPYTVLKWSILARLAGCKLALVSLGAGPLKSTMSKRFCRWSLSLAHHASYRDEPSRQLIEGRGPAFKGKVYPDVASNIEMPACNTAATRAVLEIGINPMPVFDRRYWPDGDDHLYEDYLGKLVALVRHVISQGHSATLYSTQIQDNAVIGDVLARLDSAEREAVKIAQPRTVDQLLQVLANLDISVPTRFHGSVLSVRAGKPTLGICYHRKIGDLLTDVGLGDFQVPIETFSVAEIVALLDRLVDERQSASEMVRSSSERYRTLLDQQYSELAALIDP